MNIRILLSFLFFIAILLPAGIAAQEADSGKSSGETLAPNSIQGNLVRSSLIHALTINLPDDKEDQIKSRLRLVVPLPVLPRFALQGIGYPLTNPRTETPKGKIYPSLSEGDVIVNMLLSAAINKVF